MTSPNRMPAVFIGHGSPMNALEDNTYTRAWQQLAATLPRPKAILAISAHWLTQGTAVTAMDKPRTIHDFGGFPQALFDMQYPAPGSPALAARVQSLLAPLPIAQDLSWGLDHGIWSVLVKMFPAADIPIVQLSLDATQSNTFHFALGRQLAALREEGVLLLASGNVVHNLRRMDWQNGAAAPWAQRFNERVRQVLLQGDPSQLIDYPTWSEEVALSVPTPEHFTPLLYIAGARLPEERITVPVDGIALGAISMLSAVVG